MSPHPTVHERTFRVPLRFPARGTYTVELLASDESGPEVLALLEVGAGGARIEPPPIARAVAEPEDPATAESGVLRAIAATRARRGLPPLDPDPALSEVARRHSEAMRAAGRVAHVVPGSGDLVERLRRAAIPFRGASENVASAGTALAAHAQIEASPAHLANVVRAGARRVGVGAVRGTGPSDAPIVYLTEVFVDPPEPAPAGSSAEALAREALRRARLDAGRGPFADDAALDALARAAARSMRARDDADAGSLAARALDLGRRVAAVDVLVATDAREAGRTSRVQDDRLRRVGIGVAEGESRRYGGPRLWIALVFTD